MQSNGVSAIAEVVISQKEQVVILRPIDGLLAMTVLSRKDEVKPAAAFKDDVVETPVTEAESSLADTLIKASIIKKFDFSRYRDLYKEKLTKLIQLKIEGKEVVQVRDPEEPKIINLMEALKRSVAEAQAANGVKVTDVEKKAAKAGLKQASNAKPAKGASAKGAAAKKKKVG
jgi:DNA end-binding protein Ku